MRTEDLDRKLRSVGKSIFVDHFSLFKSYATGFLSKEKSIDFLIANNVSNAAGAAIRLGNAKQIFQSKKDRDALIIVSESSRVPSNIVTRARQLLVGQLT